MVLWLSSSSLIFLYSSPAQLWFFASLSLPWDVQHRADRTAHTCRTGLPAFHTAAAHGLTAEMGTAKSPWAGTCTGVWKADQCTSRGTDDGINRIHMLLVTGSCLERMGLWKRKSVQNPQESRGWKSVPARTQSANEERSKITNIKTCYSRNRGFFTFCLVLWCPSCSGCPCILPELWKVWFSSALSSHHSELPNHTRQYSWTSLWPFPAMMPLGPPLWSAGVPSSHGV